MSHELLLLVSEDGIAEHGLEVPRLFKPIERAEEDFFDLAEDFAIVGGPRRVGEIEGLFDAQRLPVVRIVLGTSSALALFDRQHATGSDGDSVFRVTAGQES